MFKAKNRNTGGSCEVYAKSTTKTYWRRVSLFEWLNLELKCWPLICFFLFFFFSFSYRKSLYSEKQHKKEIYRRLWTSREHLPYTTQTFRCSQISLINYSRHPRGHYFYGSSFSSSVPQEYLVWLPFFHHTLWKQPFEVNLTWKPLKWNFSCNELNVSKFPGAHRN